ncbi:putative ribonuclease H-like domain-containing protein [Tanacetum coccineum]
MNESHGGDCCWLYFAVHVTFQACSKLILLFPFANCSKDDDYSCQFEGHELVERREKAFLTSVDIMELEVVLSPDFKCDKRNFVLFTDSECLVLSPDFKLPDEDQILLKIPRKGNMYRIDMKNIVPREGLTYLVAKAPLDEPMEATQSLLTKDETTKILKNFINQIENLVDKKVKIIRSDNGAEFKNKNGIAERRNRTLIEAARTMLADSKLPTTFWAKAVSTACYVQNRVLVIKPHHKTPYELFRGKFDGKSDEGFFVGYSLSSKAFRIYNLRTRVVEENLHIEFLENKPMTEGNGSLTSNDGTSQDGMVMPIWKDPSHYETASINENDDAPESFNAAELRNGDKSNDNRHNDQNFKPQPIRDHGKRIAEGISNDSEQENEDRLECSTPNVNTDGPSVSTAYPNFGTGSLHFNIVSLTVITRRPYQPSTASYLFSLAKDSTPEASNANINGEDTEIDLSNINLSYQVPNTPHTRINKYHSLDLVISDIQAGVQTRGMTKTTDEQALLIAAYERKPHKDFNECIFFCFLSQEEPKRVAKALSDSSWVEAIQEELLQFKLQKVWVLVDLPKGKRAIARIKAIRLFLAYASFMAIIVYQMNVKSAFLYGEIQKEVYVCQPPGFEDPDYPDKVYKVVKAMYGLHQAPRAWYAILANYLMDNGYQRGNIDQTLFIKRQKRDILLVQIYVDDIIFGSTKKEMCTEFEKLIKDKFQMSSMGELTFFLGLQSASTTIDLEKPLVKEGDGDDVDVHLYRSMIGSLMYLTSSRPDIMFAMCACARFQVTPKTSHLTAVKRIFRSLKGKPSLGLWYHRDSLFKLYAFFDSDYAGATQDRKSTSGECQFFGNRLVSWQCKKQTVVVTSTTEAEYIAAASCCRQVLWMQNQLLDYGYNFMNIVIHIDNTSTICIIENPVEHNKTKHIEIRYHFIRDCNAKKLIQMVKIHIDHNIADLLTKGFDAGRFQYLVSSFGMLNS